MSDLIDRQAAIDALIDALAGTWSEKTAIDAIKNLPSVVLCKDCRHQEKIFHADRRRKDGGYYIYRCELAEDYSHVCFDYESCSWGERRD